MGPWVVVGAGGHDDVVCCQITGVTDHLETVPGRGQTLDADP